MKLLKQRERKIAEQGRGLEGAIAVLNNKLREEDGPKLLKVSKKGHLSCIIQTRESVAHEHEAGHGPRLDHGGVCSQPRSPRAFPSACHRTAPASSVTHEDVTVCCVHGEKKTKKKSTETGDSNSGRRGNDWRRCNAACSVCIIAGNPGSR